MSVSLIKILGATFVDPDQARESGRASDKIGPNPPIMKCDR